MGATANYPCGCSITRSMFGKRKILSVDPCQKHLLSLVNKSLEQTAQDIVEIQNKEAERELGG